jgi:hypothetical protein
VRVTSPLGWEANPSDQTQEGIYDSQVGLQAFCPVEELSKRISDHNLEKEKKDGIVRVTSPLHSSFLENLVAGLKM